MANRRRIVVKVGSSLLANSDHLTPRFAFMHGLLSDIAKLREDGAEVVLASSGSVALGLNIIGARPEDAGVQDKQAAAACGQPILLHAYKQVALEYGFDIAQVLVTLDDLEDRRRFLNTKNTVHRLLERGIMPIVNENDTVTTEEIRVGDNDRLAAKIAQMIGAQNLVILTSVDGLYDRDPADDGAQFVERVEDVSEYLEATTGVGALGSGGMMTKMQAANMAQNAGCTTHIARGEVERPITAVLNGERRHTECVAHDTPDSPWTVWLTDRLQMAGGLVLKQSAADHLDAPGAKVHYSDVLAVHGAFQKADVLHVYDENGVECARGMANFSVEETRLLAQNDGRPIRDVLGYQASGTLINANNLVVLEERHLNWDEPDGDPDKIAC